MSYYFIFKFKLKKYSRNIRKAEVLPAFEKSRQLYIASCTDIITKYTSWLRIMCLIDTSYDLIWNNSVDLVRIHQCTRNKTITPFYKLSSGINRMYEKRRHHERIPSEDGRGNGICLSICPFCPVTRFAFYALATKASKFR